MLKFDSGLDHTQGTGNWINECELYSSDHSAKLLTHFERLPTNNFLTVKTFCWKSEKNVLSNTGNKTHNYWSTNLTGIVVGQENVNTKDFTDERDLVDEKATTDRLCNRHRRQPYHKGLWHQQTLQLLTQLLNIHLVLDHGLCTISVSHTQMTHNQLKQSMHQPVSQSNYTVTIYQFNRRNHRVLPTATENRMCLHQFKQPASDLQFKDHLLHLAKHKTNKTWN